MKRLKSLLHAKRVMDDAGAWPNCKLIDLAGITPGLITFHIPHRERGFDAFAISSSRTFFIWVKLCHLVISELSFQGRHDGGDLCMTDADVSAGLRAAAHIQVSCHWLATAVNNTCTGVKNISSLLLEPLIALANLFQSKHPYQT